MNLQQAKDTLEEIGIADEITPELVDASTIVLDALSGLEASMSGYDSIRIPSIAADVAGCDCDECIAARARIPTPQPVIPVRLVPSDVRTPSPDMQDIENSNYRTEWGRIASQWASENDMDDPR